MAKAHPPPNLKVRVIKDVILERCLIIKKHF